MRILALFIFICLSFVSQSQIVNIENQRLDVKKEGWKFDIDLNFTIIKNTRVITQFGNRNRVAWNKGQNHVMLFTDFGLVKADGDEFVNSGFTHLRHCYTLKKYPKINLETFAQAQYNRVQMIDLRMLLGSGARFEVVKQDSISLNLGAFVMAEHETQTDGIVRATARYSSFVSFDWQFSKTAGFNTITYYQPDFLFPADFRISCETSLRFAITKKVNFKIVYNLIYDSFPVPGIPTTNYFLNNAISVRF
ncbi:MAG TPA: DUF481 domain-containing protein [Flavobacteriales bacterium]|nr:DUF481 domain-containing protein [Flavobacteriales bacterium]